VAAAVIATIFAVTASVGLVVVSVLVGAVTVSFTFVVAVAFTAVFEVVVELADSTVLIRGLQSSNSFEGVLQFGNMHMLDKNGKAAHRKCTIIWMKLENNHECIHNLLVHSSGILLTPTQRRKSIEALSQHGSIADLLAKYSQYALYYTDCAINVAVC